jgi:hypothetical protein
MATERQIQANRSNALKSTGPRTSEGKHTSARNAARPSRVSTTVILKGESVRRFNQLANAIMREYQPRNFTEFSLVQTMTAARWRLLRLWGMQTAAFEVEMAAVRLKPGSPATSGAVVAAAALRTLADNSRVLSVQTRLEATYDRQYNRALAILLKLRENPNPSPASGAVSKVDLQLDTATWPLDLEDDADAAEDENKILQYEADLGGASEEDLEQDE